jgi:transcriptional regulator with XRE-family HTH domain
VSRSLAAQIKDKTQQERTIPISEYHPRVVSNLKEIREREGVRQTELAQRSGISAATIRRAEHGRVPSPVTQAKLVKALNALAETDLTVEQVFPPKP